MTNLDLDAIEARAHEFCSVCDGSGTVSCWSPGGPCPEGQTVCETCGPCQQSDVPTLVAALREARAGWAADYAERENARLRRLAADLDARCTELTRIAEARDRGRIRTDP